MAVLPKSAQAQEKDSWTHWDASKRPKEVKSLTLLTFKKQHKAEFLLVLCL